MIRFLGVLAFLVVLVAIYFWAASQSQSVSLEPTGTQVLFNTGISQQLPPGTSTANAQETATADILSANNRATFSAATSTQYAVQTQAVLQQTQLVLDEAQAQLSLRLTVDSAAESAAATGTQYRNDESAASTTTAIAGVIATQTQSFIATQQRHAAQMRQSELEQQEAIALLWIWGPPALVLVIVIVGVWAYWYWEIDKRIRRGPGYEAPPPVVSSSTQPPHESALPKSSVVIVPDPVTDPTGQLSGWLDEVKEKLRDSQKEDHGNPNV
jgi:hypothetical protein